MTDEQINIAIAETMKWKQPFGNTGDWERPDGSMTRTCRIPNYAADLNACHECVRTLTDAQRTTYREHLSKIWTWNYNSQCGHIPSHDDSVNATARQRCEAYLRTLGKWKDADHA